MSNLSAVVFDIDLLDAFPLLFANNFGKFIRKMIISKFQSLDQWESAFDKDS